MSQLDQIVSVLKAAGEPTRLRVLALLARGELTVSELVQILGQSQPRVSRHLKLLAEAGLVDRLPEGAWVFYRLADDPGGVRRLLDAAVHLADRDEPSVARDLERLEAVKAARAEAAKSYFTSVARDWDRIRALHLSERDVEAALCEAAGEGPFDFMIDIGAGTGRMLQLFADRIGQGVGVDLSHDMLTVARSNLAQAGLENVSVRQADLYALPFENACADLVVIHQVLHYLVDPGLAIFEAARTLKEDGRLLIVDFAPHDHEFLRDEHAHRRLGFADGEVGEWARAAGLELDGVQALEPAETGPQGGLTVKIWRARQTAALAPAELGAGSQSDGGRG